MKTPVATLLPLTSLKNFKAATEFIMWLKKTKQSGWQMLPITDPITVPYRGAGIGIASYFYDNKVPKEYRQWLIERNEFIARNQKWLLDYALFKALAEHFQTEKWWRWPRNLANYDEGTVISWRLKLAERIEVFIDEQYFLFNQMLQLKRKAQENEIILIGDLPFYVAQESPLVWAHQELFMLSEGGKLKLQSGVPAADDEPFDAQLWGHPLYDWEGSSTERVIDLLALRLEFLANFYDLVRIDHANGFFKYGIMSAEHPNWSKKVAGPGKRALVMLLKKVQAMNLGVFFEDIASDRMRLEQFMKEFEVAGMNVLTLLYNLENNDEQKSLKTPDKELKISSLGGNKIIFSSTHDTPPLITWVKALPEEIKNRIVKLNGLGEEMTDKGLANRIRDSLFEQPARMIIVPWQDWWLDNFRFNVPGREDLTDWNYIVPIHKYL